MTRDLEAYRKYNCSNYYFLYRHGLEVRLQQNTLEGATLTQLVTALTDLKRDGMLLNLPIILSTVMRS